MKNALKNYSHIFLTLAVFALVIGALWLLPRAYATPSTITVETTATATTTVTYLNPAGVATSTFQFDNNGAFSSTKIPTMAGIDSVTLFLQVAASSTGTTYVVQPQISNNNLDWYPINLPAQPSTGQGTFTLAASSTQYFWTPGTTATTSTSIVLPVVAAMHERVLEYVAPSTANGAIYTEVVLKKNPSNP